MAEFNPELFMQSTIEQTLDTKRELVPEGDYSGTISKLEPQGGTISKGDRAGEPWGAIKIHVTMDLPSDVAERIGRAKKTVNTMVFLDLNEQGGLAVGKGKNVDLGKWFDAAGINQLSNKNPAMLEGRDVKVRIKHAESESNAGNFYETIAGVRKP